MPAPRGRRHPVPGEHGDDGPDGTTRPSGGVLTAFEVPAGPGLRTDTFGYAGYRTSPNFDSLLAKVIRPRPSRTWRRRPGERRRALAEFRIEGVPTNIAFLQAVLAAPATS